VRVVQACPYDWDAPGGVQVHVRQLSAHLRSQGHEVLVLAPGSRSTADRGVRIVGRPLRVPYQGSVAPICFSARSSQRVAEALRSFGPDVVHAHEPLTPSTSMLATLRARVPVVATFHAYAERSPLFDLAAPLVRPVWRRLARRVAVSEAARSFVSARLEGDVVVVPNGVDVEPFALAEPASGLPPGRRLLWVGRLDRQKGFPVAVRAFAELARDAPDLVFVVAGDGRDRVATDRFPRDLRSRVVMLGTVPHDLLPPYHAAADVYVSPALGQESFGIVLVEAMAAGVPIVATDIAGYREVVRHDVEGLLVPPGDPVAFAAAIRLVLDDPALARRLGEAGRARARTYDWPVVVARLGEEYAAALGSGPPFT
jgi:phosphatidyl-myo-inositol alpha-mannosyltransferase